MLRCLTARCARDSVAIVFPGYGIRRRALASPGSICEPRARTCRGTRTAPGARRAAREAGALTTGAGGENDVVISIDHVTKRFGAFVAVDDADFDIRRGEFFSMLGPSGCGKTTTLRMIAGFEQPVRGRDPARGQRRLEGPALQAQRQHRLPAVRAVPAHDRVATTSPSASKAKKVGEGRDREAGHRAARDRAPRPTSPTASPRSSPAASSSGSPWPGRS